MVETGEILARLALGAAMGGAIGYERHVHGRPAGFRTHMLVCIASVLLMEVSEYYYLQSSLDPSFVRVDPGRIASGAITGVGFLGAGVILKMGATVQGLTTAACLWIVSAIGLALGAGLYVEASGAFGLTLFALLALRAVERATPRLSFKYLTITASSGYSEDEIMEVLKRHGASLHSTDYDKDTALTEVVMRLTVSLGDRVSIRALVEDLSAIGEVQKVSARS